MKKYVLLFAATFVAAALLFALPGYFQSGIRTVQAVRLVGGELKSTVSCSGTVTPVNSQIISYGFAVRINEILVRVGDRVKAGDTLMTVDQSATRAAMTAGQTQSTSSGTATQSQLDTLASQYGFSPSAGTSAGGSDSDATGDASAQSSLSSDTSLAASEVPGAIKAEISGVVTQLNVQSGAFSNPRAVLAVVADTSRLQIVAQVDESMIEGVRLNQAAYISGVGFLHSYTGKVALIYPAAQEVSTASDTKNVVTVAVNVDHPSQELKPNLSATVRIVTDDNRDALVVPYTAVCQDENDVEYVYLLRSGKAVRANVTTGTEYTNDVQILKGVKAGDQVIVNPSDQLASGDAVRIVSAHSGGSKK